MIKIRGLSKYYPSRFGAKYVFRDLSLDLPGDRDIAILGKNGAGKSTLLKILGGQEVADGGRIITDRSISWPLGLSSGFLGRMSGRENVRFVCRLYGVRDTQPVEDYVQEFSELGREYELPVDGYSSGMRSRYNFAVSMGFDFDTYLLDEIMAVGDQAFRQKCDEALDGKRDNANIILVSHQMGSLRRHCNAAIVLAYGRAEFYENIDRAIARYEML